MDYYIQIISALIGGLIGGLFTYLGVKQTIRAEADLPWKDKQGICYH